MKSHHLTALMTCMGISSILSATVSADPVDIHVDLNRVKGPMTPIWAWLGYDECNYTYMKDGKKLLSDFAAMSPVPVYVRTHSLLVTGDGIAALKWGSSNVYTEDADGNPVYDWTIIDKIFDIYVERGMKPLVEIGFMPQALSSQPEPYRHQWKPGDDYGDIFTGWRYPPNDYGEWADLIYQWVQHSIDRYGKEEVTAWYWELWNEPDAPYWGGTLEEYCKLYDYTADAVKRALPDTVMGGPHVTGAPGQRSDQFLRGFLDHCTQGTNYVTGETGSPLDYIGFHAKGSPHFINGHVRMNMGRQLDAIARNFKIVASYPQLKHLPIVIGESDPEGCAACSEALYPQNAYRNGTMYSSYTAASFARKYDLADRIGINFKGAVTWAFEFENQPWFYGFRELATNGVNKPVFNIFRMYGLMQGNRVQVSSNDLAYDAQSIIESHVRGDQPDINALAAKDKNNATVMVWHYHDDDVPAPDAEIRVTISPIPSTQALLFHYRVDKDHSNAYQVWKELGSPQPPSDAQISILEKAGQLAMIGSPAWIKTANGQATIIMTLPRQGVSLLKLDW